MRGTRKRRAVLVAVLAVVAGGMVTVPAGAGVASRPVGRIADDPIAHDPTIIKQGRFYYSFITGDAASRTYLPMRRSTDLLHWETLGVVFATAPAWVTAELGLTPPDFWAPDITYFDGLYHLYYAASSFGTNNSVIGLATATTLDPGAPGYGWTDHGLVLRTRTGDTVNAIDPDLVFDDAGQPWLSFGSFWDGITLRRLDRATGKPADATSQLIASRFGASIEGGSIVRHGGFYYLFLSLDFCCRGVNSDYRTVVGRARSVTGPYTDRDGVPLLAGGGTDLLRGYNEFAGPGGGDVFADGDWFAHHYYDTADSGLPKLSVRRLSWSGGWPSLGDPLSGSRSVGHGPAWFTVVNQATGAVVSNPTCGYEGADIRIAERSSSTCQQWRFEDRGNGYASMLNRASNKVAEVAACINTDAARVAQWGWLNNDCQKFRIVPAGDGWSKVENRLAGRVLESAFCGGPGTQMQVFTWLDNQCQRFRLEPVGDVIIADEAGRRVLDVPFCGPRHGGLVLPVGRRTSDCQLWHLTPTTEGWFQLVNTGASRPLTTFTLPGGTVGLALASPGTLTPATQWRLDAVSGAAYRLVNQAGQIAQLPGLAPQLQLLVP